MNDFTDLKEWAYSNKLAERTVQQFWSFFKIYQKEHSDTLRQYYDDFDDTLLIVNVDKIALQIENWPHIDTYSIWCSLLLIYKKTYYENKGKKIHYKIGKNPKVFLGYYKLYFSSTGKVEAEEFELY